METALGAAERQIERLRARETAHSVALTETRRALRATRDDSASSAMSEDGVSETGMLCSFVDKIMYCCTASGHNYVLLHR